MNAPAAPLTRVAWAEGSRLTHRDLADAIEHEARMLALHVATMHGTWGVALGLRLSIGGDLRSVRVSAGGAFTARGEPIVLRRETDIVGPRGAGVQFDLLLSPAVAPGECDRERAPACTGVTTKPTPVLRWSAAVAGGLGADVRLGAEVPLGRVTRAMDGTLSGIDYSQRRYAASLARPHVVSGVARPGQLVWQQGSSDLFATIDTDAAGFTTTPTYYASIGSDPPWPLHVVGPLLGVEQQSATGFVARIRFGAGPGWVVLLSALRQHAATVELRWIGIETASGCPPTFAPYIASFRQRLAP